MHFTGASWSCQTLNKGATAKIDTPGAAAWVAPRARGQLSRGNGWDITARQSGRNTQYLV